MCSFFCSCPPICWLACVPHHPPRLPACVFTGWPAQGLPAGRDSAGVLQQRQPQRVCPGICAAERRKHGCAVFLAGWVVGCQCLVEWPRLSVCWMALTGWSSDDTQGVSLALDGHFFDARPLPNLLLAYRATHSPSTLPHRSPFFSCLQLCC